MTSPDDFTSPSDVLDARERRKRKREWVAIYLLSFVFLALTFAEFRLTKVSSTLPFVNSIFFFGLLNLNLVLLIGLVWLVFRNIGKLFLERRRKLLGSRLKTKLVVAFLSFSIVPTVVLFIISALYINSSFDKWFSLKVQNTLQASLDITHVYYRNVEQTAMHFAEHLSKGVGRRLAPATRPGREAPTWIHDFLDSQRELLALDAVEFYQDPFDERAEAALTGRDGMPDTFPRIPLDVLDKAFGGEHISVIQHIGAGDLIRCVVPVHLGGAHPGMIVGVLAVNSYIPVGLVNKADEIASVIDDYKDTNPLRYPIKAAYFSILIMITLVIIFVAIWIGLYMARELTVPVERLVRGAQQVGAGNLDVAIASSGHDEIAVLVESFNNMIRDLRENRARLTQASVDLEKRRMQLEAVLTNVGTGVLAVDRTGEITTFNRAAAQLLEMDPKTILRTKFRESLTGEALPLMEIISASLQSHEASLPAPRSLLPEATQWNFRTVNGIKTLAAIATPLRDRDADWGTVVVVDDLTHLIKGQREMAWREVARRIAHEIKNPLTPIKLSAQRLQRRLGMAGGRDASLIQECTETIIKHTDELKEMVNEFSNFARFPEISPAPNDLNAAVREVLSLYEQGHTNIRFQFDAESKLPSFEFDRDQIKRVIINLLDNSVAALQPASSGKAPQIRVETHYHEQLQMAVVQVYDNGPGMTEDVKARIFEPYFSTKKEGTGLGLAIAKRIVNDHDGFIRVQSTPGQGTQFLIELPTAIWHGLERRNSDTNRI